ncbi:hypothetical protein GKZ90_0001145 [Flavobacterium sp. MC2016-06]|jgi:hypothetical protein|uniref:hypothetical protein n=1 Tax=Flavobacterium sp. MC2016-06 TaxID=2676308 RepID=UPI0012BAC1A3|nr:hypothetical protein [Flavobacterium sp. MC2016-06]MBU3859083.1 hypothetical protein [Flavobacterium sp. MC2016-06]
MIDYLIELYAKCEEKNIVKLIQEFKTDFAEFLTEYPITPIIEDFKNCGNVDVEKLIHEPSGLLQITLLTNALYLRLCENKSIGGLNILKNALRDALSKQMNSIVAKSSDQLTKLFELLDVISKICISKKEYNIYILELPVGNSIPSTLLQNLLKMKGVDSMIITISLNRNDSKKNGYTRKELIENKLKELDLKKTLLVYTDEWISGSNFYNITKILSKIKDLKFIPGAFLLKESFEKDDYSKYKFNHEKICGKMGFDADSLRIQLSDLNTIITSDQKFIWAESDRLAGYRKFEFFGSIISTLFATGEFLSENPLALNETIRKAIYELTDLDAETEIPDETKQKIKASFDYFNSVFSLNFEEKVITTKIEINDVFDLVTETNKAILKLKSIKGYNNAQMAINITSYYMREKVFSPSSRYFYKGFAPVCLPLENDEKYLHTLFLEQIKNQNFYKRNFKS